MPKGILVWAALLVVLVALVIVFGGLDHPVVIGAVIVGAAVIGYLLLTYLSRNR